MFMPKSCSGGLKHRNTYLGQVLQVVCASGRVEGGDGATGSCQRDVPPRHTLVIPATAVRVGAGGVVCG